MLNLDIFKRNIVALGAAFTTFLALGVCVETLTAQAPPVTRQETLRGSVTPEREWWDVLHYDLSVQFMPDRRMIQGSNVITFKTLKPGSRMQIDLQTPLNITKITRGNTELKFEREGNVFWVTFDKELAAGIEEKITITYGGRPTEARNPPWEGGIAWGRDDLGNWFIN
ncbi:MAG: M1 family peptidase, partial [Pyrinomonadaceae bacterium]